MSSRICVDANLILKLVLVEEDSPLVHELWDRWIDEEVEIVAPSLLAFEGTSVIRNKVHRGLVPPDEGELMFEAFQAQGVKLLYPEGLHRIAWELAKRFNRPTAYDSHYLALADMLSCELWTGDRRLYNAVKDELPWVKWLVEFIEYYNDRPHQGVELDGLSPNKFARRLADCSTCYGTVQHQRYIWVKQPILTY